MSQDAPLLLRQIVPMAAYKPRLHLNGFPKSGLHMLEQFVSPLLNKSKVGHQGNEWLGSFMWNGWSNKRVDKRGIAWRLSCMERGAYLKGHLGYDEDVERLMYFANIGQIFICRDFRDVAVSQAHHVYDNDIPTLQHQHKEVYQMYDSFDDVISACITGMGPYPGVMDRWHEYVGWLGVEWVMKFKYEDIRADPAEAAGAILRYAIKNATELLEDNKHGVDCTEETYNRLVTMMVESAADTAHSTSFRKGKVGSWRDEFKPEHVELFKKHDPDKWLLKLGYEKDDEWKL